MSTNFPHRFRYLVSHKKSLHHLLLHLCSGSALQKPADEGDPKPVRHSSREYLPHSPNDKKKSEEPASACGDHRGPTEILGHAPDDGAKNAASVQRKSWYQIEQSQ